ncbi:MAG: hypothetical protein ACI835_005017 [Planctomycetota bacterium]
MHCMRITIAIFASAICTAAQAAPAAGSSVGHEAARPAAVSATLQDAPQQDALLERINSLIASGRKLLDAQQFGRALENFSEAHSLAGESFETYVWILRTWLDQGRINDVLNKIDYRLEKGHESADLDYLIGMAFHRRAKDHIKNGIPDQTTNMSFTDAVNFLGKATEANAPRFYDAFGALAESAWFTQENDLAQVAALRAVELSPDDSKVQYLLAQVRFSRFVIAEQAQEGSAAANSLWAEALADFERTRAMLLPPKSDEEAARLGRIGIQIGYAHLWRDQVPQAIEATAEAISWDPLQDYPTLQGTFELADFRATLESGHARFQKRFGAEDKRESMLLWWLGFARFSTGLGGPAEEGAPPLPLNKDDMRASEEAFQQALAHEPSFSNSWYYIGLARYYRDDYQGLLDAFHTVWDIEPSNLVGMLTTDRELNLRIMDYVLGWCHENKNEIEPAFLCELRVGFFPESWEYWDNLGYFARNAGASLSERNGGKPTEEDAQEATRLWERAVAAYAKAYEMAGDHPHLLNDMAVVLHYYLKRNLDDVRTMYEGARDQANAVLAAGGLNEADLEWASKALRDSEANLRVMDGLEEPDLSR